MKTKIIIIIAIFCLSIIIFANANQAMNNRVTVISLNTKLAPVTPFVADFYESAPETMVDVARLAPITPKEADFYDARENQQISNDQLRPSTPKVADFEEI